MNTKLKPSVRIVQKVILLTTKLLSSIIVRNNHIKDVSICNQKNC